MPLSATKLKACKACGTYFKPFNSLQVACSYACADKLAPNALAAGRSLERQKPKIDVKRQTKKKEEPNYERQAQEAVNAYVRFRDEHKPCIVHGWNCPYADQGWHAGHFKSRASQPALRFNTLNIHKQCGTGNKGAHKYSRYERGVSEMYEEALRARMGDPVVDWLNGPHKAKQYTKDDLKRIGEIFRAKLKLYRKLRERGYAGGSNHGAKAHADTN